MRLDKFLKDTGFGSRKEVKVLIKQKRVSVNDEVISNEGISVDDVNEELFGKYLYNDLPDVDLLIRTSGEIRLSNFLLWELSYAEFYFTKIKFPAFTTNDFDDAIVEYTRRDRRFGGIKEN